MHLNDLRKLLRMEQWHKNVLILTAFLFTNNHLPLIEVLLGFLGFCTLSSVTYIFNDWMDRKKDRTHPQKKDRPLASGKVTGKQALVVALLLLSFTTWTAWQLGVLYIMCCALYFLATNLYSLGLKNVPLLDIGLILLNFNLRTLAGFETLPTLNDRTYFLLLSGLVLFSITSKRNSDRTLLGEKAIPHKPVLQFYTKNRCRILMLLSYLLVGIGIVTLTLQKDQHFLEALFFVLMMFYTNWCFMKDPTLAIKAHYLFKNPVWTLLFLFLILFPLFS